MQILVTAGFNKSKAAIAMCEMVKRSGHEVAGILIVTPFSVKRFRQLLIQRGLDGVKAGIQKLTSISSQGEKDYLGEFLAQEEIQCRSVIAWAKKNNIAYKVVKNINSSSALEFVSEKNASALLYGGGGILRESLINAASGTVINPHCGPLPEIRGMNAIEWAFLLDYPIEITVHFIDEGIDTGEIISRVPCEFQANMSLEELRAKAVITGIREIFHLLASHKTISILPRKKNIGVISGRQCYVMAPALRELVSYKLQEKNVSSCEQ